MLQKLSRIRGAPMQTDSNPDLFGFAPVEGRGVMAAFDGGRVISDAGALLLGRRIEQLASSSARRRARFEALGFVSLLSPLPRLMREVGVSFYGLERLEYEIPQKRRAHLEHAFLADNALGRGRGSRNPQLALSL